MHNFQQFTQGTEPDHHFLFGNFADFDEGHDEAEEQL